MQFGVSKDHRPDLPQLKLMAAAAEPSGHLIASDVYPGQRADDPLYTPLIRRVRELLSRKGLLYTGDCVSVSTGDPWRLSVSSGLLPNPSGFDW